MENCSLPDGALLSESKAGGEEARLGGVEQRLGGGFSSNVQTNLVQLSSSAAGEQQMRVAGILGGWVLFTSCAEQLPPLLSRGCSHIYLQKLETP
ncbi:hypothetical protein SLEP1_g33551 [Rubroshorea leprosula]|uniref:Uncharacterized protein n=1 Tax=Rubroshorea leprosula TaxID=152421 RepID=A0AAV5KGY6_9ROSI|nr:hypothetical protein SLEP1_g33551 [Rubroshorea leprosula]